MFKYLILSFKKNLLRSLFYFSFPLYRCGIQVLSCILDPLLQLCTVSASNLGTADMATYMVNSLYMMKTTLALFEFTDKRLEMLEFQVWRVHTVNFKNPNSLLTRMYIRDVTNYFISVNMNRLFGYNASYINTNLNMNDRWSILGGFFLFACFLFLKKKIFLNIIFTFSVCQCCRISDLSCVKAVFTKSL